MSTLLQSPKSAKMDLDQFNVEGAANGVALETEPLSDSSNITGRRLKSPKYNMEWHIINHRDYIEGPFDSNEGALEEACALGKENRVPPKTRRRAKVFRGYPVHLAQSTSLF